MSDGVKMKRRYWTAAEIRKLRRLYPNMENSAIGKRLRRTWSAVQNRALKLGLRKSPEFMAGHFCRFQNGMRTWNRGLTGYMGANRTSFRNGNRPVTWRPIGSERVDADGHLVRKVKDTGSKRDWKPVKDLLWMRAYGRIPRGRFVVMKDRNRGNITLSNLELVNRAENMLRNSIYRYPPSLVRLMKLRAKLGRTIERAEREEQAIRS